MRGRRLLLACSSTSCSSSSAFLFAMRGLSPTAAATAAADVVCQAVVVSCWRTFSCGWCGCCCWVVGGCSIVSCESSSSKLGLSDRDDRSVAETESDCESSESDKLSPSLGAAAGDEEAEEAEEERSENRACTSGFRSLLAPHLQCRTARSEESNDRISTEVGKLQTGLLAGRQALTALESPHRSVQLRLPCAESAQAAAALRHGARGRRRRALPSA